MKPVHIILISSLVLLVMLFIAFRKDLMSFIDNAMKKDNTPCISGGKAGVWYGGQCSTFKQI